jgi:hypothetical protein
MAGLETDIRIKEMTIPENFHPITAHAAIGEKIALRGKWKRVINFWRNGRDVEIVSYTNDHWYARKSDGHRIRHEYYVRVGGIVISPPYYNYFTLEKVLWKYDNA